MNTIWLKIAAAAVAIVIAIVLVGRLTSSDKPAPEPPAKTRTFDQTVERDKKLNEAPKLVEQPPAQEPAPQPEPQPAQQPAQQPPAQTPAQQLASRPAGVVYPSDLKGPTTLYFMPLSEEDDIQAQQILPYAVAGRSIGRLPMVQYGLMNKACLQIEERWPNSWYCFRAKQMLEEITTYQDRYAQMYKITPQRLDISKFMKPRKGTEPREVRPIQR
jgi:hypothetical protein